MSDPTPPLPQLKSSSRLGPRDISSAAQHSRAYSRIVAIMRWALPLVVFGGLALLVIWPHVKNIGIKALIVPKIPNLMVEKLNLTGVDSKNQPYALTATRALQAGNLKNVIDLEHPKGELTLKDGGWISGGGLQGRYDQTTEKLWIGGDVELFHDKGYRFMSDELFVDIKKNIAWSEKDVLFQGPFGTIRGKAFQALEGGSVVILKGPATARLYLRK